MGDEPLARLRVPLDELSLRQVESLDEFVYIIYRGHLLEIIPMVAPFAKDTPQESYAIHPSAWKGDSQKYGSRIVHILNPR
jgi:hypothetical protein